MLEWIKTKLRLAKSSWSLIVTFQHSKIKTPKTGGASSCNLSKLIGPGRKLLPSQVPTNRDIMRLALYIREMDDRRMIDYSSIE